MADEVTIIEFDIEYGDGIKETERLTKELIEQRDKVKELGKSHRDLEKVLGSSAESVKKLKKNELEAKDKLSELNRERKKAVDITKIQANSLEGLRKQTKAMIAEREKLNTSTVKGSKRFTELTNKIKQNNVAIKKADSATRSYSNSFGKGLAKMAAFAGGVGLLIHELKDAFNTVRDFEKAIDKLQAITKASGNEIKLLRGDAIKLGSTTSKTASQVAELQTEFAKLGLTVQQIRDVTDATIQLSIAADTGLGQAAAVAGKTLKGFKLEAKETQRVVDVMALSFSSSGLNINNFQESMKLVAPTANATGRSIETTTALLGILADNAIEGSLAGTQLARTFIELNKKGLTLEDAMEKVSSSSNKLGTATDLVGDRGAKALLIFAESTEELNKLTISLENADGAAQQMAETMEDNLAGDVNKAKSAWEGLVLSIDNGEGIISSSLRFITTGFTAFINTMIMANKTVAEIGLVAHLRSLAEGAREDVKQFQEFNKTLEERTGKEQDLMKNAELFLEVDKKRLQTIKALKKAEFERLKEAGLLTEGFKQIQEEAHKNEIGIINARIKAIQGFVNASKKSDIELLKQQEIAAKNKKAIQDKQNADFNKLLEEQEEEESEQFEKELGKDQENADLLFQQKGEAKLKELELEEEANEKILKDKEKLQQALFSGSQLASNSLFNALSSSLKNEETRISSSYDKRQKALKDQLNAGLITQEQFDKKSKDLERTKAQEIHKIELARHNQKKVQAFVNIAIDIAQAVAKVWAETGLGGIILQSLPIAAGVVQAGIVASQPAPQAPSFKEGGDVKSFMIGGNSHETGGTTFTGSDGSKFVAEKDEGMFITKKGSATLDAIAHINSLNGGRGLNNVSQYYALGGSVITNGTDIDLVEATVTSVLQNVKLVVITEDIQTSLDERESVINVGVI